MKTLRSKLGLNLASTLVKNRKNILKRRNFTKYLVKNQYNTRYFFAKIGILHFKAKNARPTTALGLKFTERHC